MSDATPMSSTRPYLIRAMYEWIVDNRCTPHLLVDAKDPQVRVPRQFVDKGVIVLNVSPTAVKHLVLGLDNITFSARFSGTPHDIDVPVPAVQAIYARENGQGIFLGEGGEEHTTTAPAAASDGNEPPPPAGPGGGRPAGRAPHLTVVK
jgi:stringent starvation protein B